MEALENLVAREGSCELDPVDKSLCADESLEFFAIRPIANDGDASLVLKLAVKARERFHKKEGILRGSQSSDKEDVERRWRRWKGVGGGKGERGRREKFDSIVNLRELFVWGDVV